MADMSSHTSLVDLNLRRNALTSLTTQPAPAGAATVRGPTLAVPAMVSGNQPSAQKQHQAAPGSQPGEGHSALPVGLERLVLSHNRFRALPALEPISSLTSLTELQVEGCPLARAMGGPGFRAAVLQLCTRAQQLKVLDMQQVMCTS
jgi:Leucine-rich repeat (LRR) protein